MTVTRKRDFADHGDSMREFFCGSGRFNLRNAWMGHLSWQASIWEWANKLNLRAHEGRKARAGVDLNKRLIVKRPRGRFCAQQRRNMESLKTEVHGLCLGVYGLCLVKLP